MEGGDSVLSRSSRGAAEGKEDSDGAGGTEGQGTAEGVESRGDGWTMTDQGGGKKEPSGDSGLTSHGREEGLRGWRQVVIQLRRR